MFRIAIESFAQEKNITMDNATDRHPVWSPDKKYILFESDRNNKWGIFVVDLISSKTKMVIGDSFHNRIPAYHPTCKKNLFESDRTGIVKLYEYYFDTKEIKLLITESVFRFNQQWASWSPDGRFVAFCSDSSIGDNKWNIYLFSIQNRTITQITFDAVRSLYPVWSFKSNAIVFFSRRDTQGQDDEIYWLHLNRMTPKRLTHEPYNNFCPSWDSKRRFLIYAKSMEGDLRPELFLLNLKNLKQHRLTFNKDGDTEPNISPDGKQLAWSAFRNGNFEIVISNINAMAGNGQ